MSRPVRITIAESSEIIRRGLVAILKAIGTLQAEVNEVSDADQLKNSISWQRPDILVVNPSMLSVLPLQQIKKEAADTDMKCIALQSSLADSSVTRSFDEVFSIYDTGEQISDKLSRLMGKTDVDKRHESLSQREKEVIVCVVKGMTNKQIADKLCLSAHTVVTHRRNISAKLDIHSTAGLTIYAIVNKLVELDEIDRAEISE